MNKKAILFLFLFLLVLIGGGWLLLRLFAEDTPTNSSTKTEQKTMNTENSTASTELGCTRSVNTASFTEPIEIKTLKKVQLSIKDFGTVVIETNPEAAPKTVENFLKLTRAGYYDCISFHRVIQGFMIQGGDPTGSGGGGESAFGGDFADEINPESELYKTGYKKGVVAMANRGPNTNGSQFFIMHEDTPLPPSYTIFGKVIAGQDVVDKIANTETDSSDKPRRSVVITKAVILSE